MPKRHCLSHAVGGASCAAWQFRPRGTHRVRLFSLDFHWFSLVSRQERTLNMLFTKILPRRCNGSAWLFGKATTYIANTPSPGSSFQNYSAPSGLVKIVRSIQGAAPLATYYAPSGLKSAGRRTGSGILNPPLGGQVLELFYPLSLSEPVLCLFLSNVDKSLHQLPYFFGFTINLFAKALILE